MTMELTWLTYTVMLTAVMWIPYILDRIVVRGLIPAISDTGPETHEAQSVWAKRAIRAHDNSVENLVVFAAAVLTAHVAGISNGVTQTAVVVYFLARLAHWIVYTTGVPILRTITFAVSWIASFAILATIVGWV